MYSSRKYISFDKFQFFKIQFDRIITHKIGNRAFKNQFNYLVCESVYREDKLSPIVVNNSNLESQTTRLLVTGQTIEMSKDKTFSTVVEEQTSTLRGDSLGATE